MPRDTVEIAGSRIVLVRQSGSAPGIISAVPGAYWSKRRETWTFPLTMETCRLLRDYFGPSLRVGRELRSWARKELEHRASQHALSLQSDAELQRLSVEAPKLYAAMDSRKYQRVGVRFAVDGHATLIADEPGLGKTLIAIGAIVEHGVPGPYLICGPKTAALAVWFAELRRWLPRGRYRVVPAGYPDDRAARMTKLNLLLSRASLLPFTFVIVHPQMLETKWYWECKECKRRTRHSKKTRTLVCKHPKRKAKIVAEHEYPPLFEVEWGGVVMDESHESLVKRRGEPTQRRRGIDSILIRDDALRIAMSGTPFRGKPFQLWGTLNWLNGRIHNAFWRWIKQFWTVGGFSGWEIGQMIPGREELLWDSLKGIALRRTKTEVAADLPPKIHVGSPLWSVLENSQDTEEGSGPVGIWLQLTDKQRRAYAQMERDTVAELEGGTLNSLGALSLLTRLRQLAASYGRLDGDRFIPILPSNKFDFTLDVLEEHGFPRDPTTKVLIVGPHSKLLKLFQQELNRVYKREIACLLTGQVTGGERFRLIRDFNNSDRHHIMCLNVKAGGTAITIDSADTTIFIGETPIPDDQTQAEDRTHRVSNPRTVRYYYLRSLMTVDIATAMINSGRDAEGRRLLDERRGVAYVRHVISHSRPTW